MKKMIFTILLTPFLGIFAASTSDQEQFRAKVRTKLEEIKTDTKEAFTEADTKVRQGLEKAKTKLAYASEQGSQLSQEGWEKTKIILQELRDFFVGIKNDLLKK